MINIPSSVYDYISRYQGTSGASSLARYIAENNKENDLIYKKLDTQSISATYDLKTIMKTMPSENNERLLKDTTAIMTGFYEGELSETELKNEITSYIKNIVGESDNSLYKKERVKEACAQVYEYISRANARCAVDKNTKEGIKYFTENGVKSDDMDYYTKLAGTVYYSGEYYHKFEDAKSLIKDALDDISREYGVPSADYDSIEKNTIFKLDGGLSFNGVWNFHQYQTNHYWMDIDQKTSVINEDFVPPKDFVYAFTNSIPKEVAGKLAKSEKTKQEKSSDEDKKNNSDLKQYARLMLMELKYGGIKMLGKSNLFGDTMSKNNWNFLMPSSKNNFSDYFRAVYYKE